MGESISQQWLVWLKESALTGWVWRWVWTYPLVETAHILGIVLLVGSVALFDLRLLGMARHHLRVTDLARFFLPRTYVGLAVVMLSGFVLFATDAPAFAINPAFRLKLILLLGTGINAAVFHWKCYPSVQRWNLNIKPPKFVRAILVPRRYANAIISLMLWTAVIVCGSLIAYV